MNFDRKFSILASMCLFLAVSCQRAIPGPFADGTGYLTIDVEDKPAFAVFNYIRDLTGKNIVYFSKEDWSICECHFFDVTIRLDRVKWTEALHLICHKNGFRYEILDGNVWKIYVHPEVVLKLEDAPVETIVDTISRIAEKNIVYGPETIQGRRTSVLWSGVPWEDALDDLARSMGLQVLSNKRENVFLVARPGYREKGQRNWKEFPSRRKLPVRRPGPRIDFDSSAGTFGSLLERILVKTGETLVMGDGALEFVDREIPGLFLRDVPCETVLELAVEKIGAKLDRLEDGGFRVHVDPEYTLSFESTTLRNAISAIERMGGFLVDVSRGVDLNLRITARLFDLPHVDALVAVGAAAGYTVRETTAGVFGIE